MRRSAACAAVALLLAGLAAPACKPSSLTPFTDWRAPETSADNVNGSWQGTTATGGEVIFQVGSDTVGNLLLNHDAGPCSLSFESTDTATVEGDAFTFEIFPDQGQLTITGRFTSTTECSGTYSFDALAAAGSCPTSGSGTFTASKIQ